MIWFSERHCQSIVNRDSTAFRKQGSMFEATVMNACCQSYKVVQQFTCEYTLGNMEDILMSIIVK